MTSAFEGRNVLVTGGAGFIGSHLVEWLVELGAKVTSASRNPDTALTNLRAVLDKIAPVYLDLATGDVERLIDDGKFDFVFHLAASAHVQTSVVDPKTDFEENALATLNLLDAIRVTSPGTHLVHASSAMVYRSGGAELITESQPLHPHSPYGVSKLAAELYVSIFAELYGLRTAVARLFPVYGPRLRKHVSYELITRLQHDGAVLPMLGDGTQVRDFSYVTDVVDALLLIAEQGPLTGEAYNVASGEPVTIDELARMIADAMGLSPRLEYSRAVKTGDTAQLFADTQRLRALGYAPKVGLSEGIRRTVEWALGDGFVERRADKVQPNGSLRSGPQ